MQLTDTHDCLEYAYAWAGHATFKARMSDAADNLYISTFHLRDDGSRMRYAKMIRFLTWAKDQTSARIHSTTLTEAVDIGWGIRTP